MRVVVAGLSAVLAMSAHPALGQKAEVSCKTYGYVIDPDPKGVNVRAGPSTKARKIGVLPKAKDGTMVDVVGSRFGWLKINRAEAVDGKITWRRIGWVHASRLGTSTQPRGNSDAVTIYAGASRGASRVATVGGEVTLTLIQCAGGWVRGRGKTTRGRDVTGWIAPNNQCAHPVTTCP